MSRHLEEKQQKTANEDKQRITMLVKRVKELESKAGKGTVSVGHVVTASDNKIRGCKLDTLLQPHLRNEILMKS
jgi:hypothetical protein